MMMFYKGKIFNIKNNICHFASNIFSRATKFIHHVIGDILIFQFNKFSVCAVSGFFSQITNLCYDYQITNLCYKYQITNLYYKYRIVSLCYDYQIVNPCYNYQFTNPCYKHTANFQYAKAKTFYKFLILPIFLVLFSSNNLLAQTDSSGKVNDEIFRYLEEVTEDKDETEFYELFDELLSNPLNLNNTNINELLLIPFITKPTATAIVKYIQKKKGISEFNELYKIRNINENELLLLKPFVKIIPVNSEAKKFRNKISLRIRSRVIEDFNTTNRFYGDENSIRKLKSYQRMKGSYGNLRIGVLTEKDAGEKSFADFYSGFAQYKSKGIIKNIIAGDFVFEFGQGLAVWSPYAFSKGSDATTSIGKRARNFIAYSSSDENNYFRGIASTISFGKINFSAFYSQNNIDGTLLGTDSVSSLYLSGYHRTETELSKKDNLTLTTVGVSAIINISKFFRTAFLHYQARFSLPFMNKNNFSLNGKNFSFTSASYDFFYKNISVNGEFSFNGTSVASINNLSFYINNSFTLVTSVRNYPHNYFNLFSKGFGENNSTQNELGFYIGAKWESVFGTLNVYYDIFKQPYSNFNSLLPSNGNDFLIHLESKIKKNIRLIAKYKSEVKEKEFITNNKKEILNETKNNYRLEINYKLSKNFYGRNRIELVNYNAVTNETGILTFQDIKLYWRKINLTGRIIFFDTESYNSRIYEFENNHRGLLTNLPMYGNGFRWYFIFNYRPLHNVKISARYSETHKPKQQAAVKNKLQNTFTNRFSLQIDIRF